MKIYFSHPTFTYHTKTSRMAKEIIKRGLEPDKIIDPADYSLRKDPTKFIAECEGVVGMSISNKLTFLVWKEMERGEDNGVELYTLLAEGRSSVGPMVEGVPDSIEKLSHKESKHFSKSVMKQSRDGLVSLLFGNWNRRF